jgi:ketosteroid isomerase-like protein
MQRMLGYALIGLAVLVATPCHADEDDAALIKRQSQAFSDASASGDTKTLARYLDEHVVFINENGDIASKADLTASGPPPSKSVSNRLVQTDFAVQLHGDVAVTRFVDNATVHVGEQVVKARYLSTEVWQKEGDAWLMISSQTLALSDDPVAQPLAPAVLDDYVGTYQAAPGWRVTIKRQGSSLVSTTNGAPPTPLLAELRDVLFTPGQPRLRRIFERDEAGKIIGFVSRREGHDLSFRKIG